MLNARMYINQVNQESATFSSQPTVIKEIKEPKQLAYEFLSERDRNVSKQIKDILGEDASNTFNIILQENDCLKDKLSIIPLTNRAAQNSRFFAYFPRILNLGYTFPIRGITIDQLMLTNLPDSSFHSMFDDENYKPLIDSIVRNSNLPANMVMGNVRLLKTFIVAHELGHAKFINDENLSGKSISPLLKCYRDRMPDVKILKYNPFVESVKRLFSRKQQKQEALERSSNYRKMKSEIFADKFAGEFIIKHGKELGII